MNTFTTFNVHRRLKIFRGAVKFKRFWNEGTKFKRICLMRLHHRNNWLIYLNVFKYWVQDLQFSRHYVRFQFFNRFFVNNYIIFDGDYIKRQKLKLFLRQDQWVSSSLTRRFFYALNTLGNASIMSSYQSANHVHAFFPHDELEPNLITLPVFSVFDLQIFGLNSDVSYEDEFLDLSSLFFMIAVQQQLEIYKILTFLLHFKLN